MRSKAAAAALLLLLLPGCALIKQGTSQTVTFKSKPDGASFMVDGKKYTTPCTLTLPKEERVLEFELDKNFEKTTRRLTTRTSSYFYWSLAMGFLSAGVDWITGAWKEFDIENDEVVVALKESRVNPVQTVGVWSDPQGAIISIDGADLPKRAGTEAAPAFVAVVWKMNEHKKEIKLRVQGFKERILTLMKGEPQIGGILEIAPAVVLATYESSPPGAEVFVEGIRIGTTPVNHSLEWAPKGLSKPVEFRKPGYETFKTEINERTVTVRAPLKETVHTTLLNVDCLPAAATLEVEGVPLGPVPSEIRFDWTVTRTRRTLKFSRPGYESQEIAIDETTGPVKVRLRPAIPRLP